MSESLLVNDVHSRLTPTLVPAIHYPATIDELSKLVRTVRLNKWQLSVCGGKHSMGGQAYGRGCHLVDLARMNSVIFFDQENGHLKAQAGMMWPELIAFLKSKKSPWMIRQKQTGADHLSLGGALAVNMHGRGLGLAPFVDDIEEITVVCANGIAYRCSRKKNNNLFSLVVGGYGNFGIVADVTLRLTQRKNYRRSVTMMHARDAVKWLEQSQSRGAGYGDFQFNIDPASEGFLQEGISACYHHTTESPTGNQPALRPIDIEALLHLAHHKPDKAFKHYTDHYQKTDGMIYDGEEMQLSAYPDDYHQRFDQKCKVSCPGSEMISEVSVPRDRLADYLSDAADFLRKNNAQVIYGTVRLIEKDTTTFLPWARRNWACTVFNLHVDHCPQGLEKAKAAFRGLIDLALERGGTFYLAYHRWATREQLLQAYPELPDWLHKKRKHDPTKLWVSDWFRALEKTIAKASIPTSAH